LKIDFLGKVALVTGGGSGIGRAICLEFAKSGAKVVCIDINSELGEKTVSLIKNQGGESTFIYADVTKASDVENFVKQSVDRYGKIDVFANNAGWEGVVELTTDYPEEVFDKVMAINVKGIFLGMKFVLPQMIHQKSGSIVNTASRTSFIGAPGFVAYTASKHAVLGMTKTAALEVARQGIRVNAICPGSVNTPLLERFGAMVSSNETEAFLTERAKSIPDGRLAEPNEVARQVLYLASDLASHVTGQSLIIDGGSLAT
jgi:3alpha(or 20beta)-hydroxysteroid dehydrogenase